MRTSSRSEGRREVVGTTGVPLGTADMAPFVSKISGSFDGPLRHLLRRQRGQLHERDLRLGLTKKYKYAGDGAIAESTHLAALGQSRGFSASTATSGDGPAAEHAASQEVLRPGGRGLKQIDPSARCRPLRAVEFEAMTS